MSTLAGEDQATIGVLGGMGPAATVDFHAKLIEATPADRDQDHPRTLIWSDSTIPDRTNALTAGGPHPGRQLADGALRLEQFGADVIAVPCNTAHAFLPEVRAAVRIPVLDMIEETINAIACSGSATSPQPVGLLATVGTIRARLYEQSAARRGIQLIIPEDGLQARIMSAIQLVKADPRSERATELVSEAVHELAAAGADSVIAACTEIPVALVHADALPITVIDPTVILAAATVKWAREHGRGGSHPDNRNNDTPEHLERQSA